MKNFVWFLGFALVLFVIYKTCYNKENFESPDVEYIDHEEPELIEPPDQGFGVGPGTYGFGRFGDSMMT
jgi:hypothetical protein